MITRHLALLIVALMLISFASQATAAEPTPPTTETNLLRKTLEAQGYVCIEIERMNSKFFTTEVKFGKHALRMEVATVGSLLRDWLERQAPAWHLFFVD